MQQGIVFQTIRLWFLQRMLYCNRNVARVVVENVSTCSFSSVKLYTSLCLGLESYAVPSVSAQLFLKLLCHGTQLHSHKVLHVYAQGMSPG